MGFAHASDGANPVPKDLGELTTRIAAMARRVLGAAGRLEAGSVVRVKEGELYADDAATELWALSPNRVTYQGRDVGLSVDYRDGPLVIPGKVKNFSVLLSNSHPEAFVVRCTVEPPPGWAAPADQTVQVAAGGMREVGAALDVPDRRLVNDVNVVRVGAAAEGRPIEPHVSGVFVGAPAWRASEAYWFGGDTSAERGLDKLFHPETVVGDVLSEMGRLGKWQEVMSTGNEIHLDGVCAASSVVYLQGFLRSPIVRGAWAGVNATCPVRLMVNGTVIAQSGTPGLMRPSYAGHGEGYGSCTLRRGWNEVLIKLAIDRRGAVPKCHFLVSSDDRMHDGLADVGRTRFPWS